jgi:hypothetical protein
VMGFLVVVCFWFWLVSSELGRYWFLTGGGAGLSVVSPCGFEMERRFSVEAYKFFFSVRVDTADFRLEERRKIL